MILKRRHLVVCKVTIKGAEEPTSKAMTTDVSLALPDTRPATITQALNDFAEQHWSSKPHEIVAVRQITVGDALYAVVEFEG